MRAHDDSVPTVDAAAEHADQAQSMRVRGRASSARQLRRVHAAALARTARKPARSRTPSAIGAHTVGAEDSAGRSSAITRWSTAGGNLRVPHFVGLRALQLLPLLGLVLGRKLRARPARAAHLTRIASFGFLGLFVTFLVRASRAQPVLAADAITWAMLGGVLLGSTALSWAQAGWK